MTTSSPFANSQDAAIDTARLHATLRMAVAVTAAFLACEILEWAPSFIAPALAVVLVSSLPNRPPLKMMVGLTAMMAVAALFVFWMSLLLRGIPIVLFGAIALCLFLAFHTLLTGGQKVKLPMLLLLICLATIPVVVMVAPAYAGVFPLALIRGIALALVAISLAYLAWPAVLARPAAPTPGAAPPAPIATALLATAVVLPLMLAYLLLGLADALPVLVTTVLLVINFEVGRSRKEALNMILGNFAGGLLGFLMHAVLLTTPTLSFLGLMIFIMMMLFAQRIAAGGAAAPLLVIACNSALIILSSSIASGPGSIGVWLTRLFQFALAGAFAVGMMSLLWPRGTPAPSRAAVA